MTFGEDAQEWLGQSLGMSPHCLDASRMKGATSSSLFLIRCSRGSHSRRFVLRVLDNREWLAEEPDLAAHEAAALEEARKAGLRTPRLVAYSTREVGFGAPVVLMSFVEGAVELRPANFPQWLGDLARELARIHRHTADAFPWRFRSWVDRAALTPPRWTAVPQIWERAIERALGEAPESRPVFLHRDYHPVNVLWQKGTVSGVVDWINACRGPAGADVAHCRTNLALMFGSAAADQFLDRYREAADGFEYHPYWDLDSLLDMCLPEPGFYGPWQEFGLNIIAPDVLRQRVDDHLECVMMRT